MRQAEGGGDFDHHTDQCQRHPLPDHQPKDWPCVAPNAIRRPYPKPCRSVFTAFCPSSLSPPPSVQVLQEVSILPYPCLDMRTDQKLTVHQIVLVDPDIMHGTPCFTGTRVPVQTLLDYIEEGDTIDAFLADFPT